MEHRVTLLLQRRARAQIIKNDGEPGYFHWLYVEPSYRRRGYALELMKFGLQHTQEFLEMDILRRAKACQRNAAKLGYRGTGADSDRYFGCELWRHTVNGELIPVSRLSLLRSIIYEGPRGRTEVLYLGDRL